MINKKEEAHEETRETIAIERMEELINELKEKTKTLSPLGSWAEH